MFEDDYLIDLSHVTRHVKHRKRLGEYFPKRDHHPRFDIIVKKLLNFLYLV